MIYLTSLFHRFTFIKQIPIFNKLNWVDIQRIALKSSLVEYKKGELICAQGDPPNAFFCLISGRIRAFAKEQEGHISDVDFIRRGMYFGIISLLTGENHSLSFEVINDSTLLKIEKEDFLSILKGIPQLGIDLSQSLSRRIRSRISQTKTIFESTIISVYSPIQKTGSSTYAVNLAFALQKEAHKKVILVNINNRSLSNPLSMETDKIAYPIWEKEGIALHEIVHDYEKLTQSIHKSDLAIDLLNIVYETKNQNVFDHINQLASALTNEYHFVVVDLPNESEEIVLKTLIQSDIVYLLTLDHKSHLNKVRQIIYQIEDQLKERFDGDKIKILISGQEDKCYLSFEEISQEIDFVIYKQLPHIAKKELSVYYQSDLFKIHLPQTSSLYAQAIRKIARQVSGVMVGLVLGGGAALGIAHIGVLRVLEKAQIPVDIVVGSSMGALLGSLWVTGHNSKDLEQLAKEFESRKKIFNLFDPVLPISGFIGGHKIKRWLIKKGLKNKTFYNTQIPLKIVAYDLTKRQEMVIDSGFLVDAIRKSIAIPGLINPVLEDYKVIIDGGVLNPVPTNVLLSLGIKKIIAINVLQSPEQITKSYVKEQKRLAVMKNKRFKTHPLQFIKFYCFFNLSKMFKPNISDIIVRSLQASEYVIAEQSMQHADVQIHPDLSELNWYELYKVDDLIKKGESAARKALPKIQNLVSE